MNEGFSINNLFPSRYLKPSDLSDTDLIITITKVIVEDLGRGDHKEEKGVIYAKEITKGFVLNKVNALTIAKMYGDQTSGWIGKRIALYTTEVSFQGTPMLGIRVRMRPPGQGQIPPQSNPDQPGVPPDSWA